MPLFVIDQAQDEQLRPLPSGAQDLGFAAGVRWVKSSFTPAGTRTPTADERAAAGLELPAIRQLKAAARRKIEAEMGDIHDLLADQSKQIEALMALICRLSADYLGGTQMTDELKSVYAARVEAVVTGLDSGALLMRGELESADDMLSKTLLRANRINEIIAAEYLPRRAQVID
ncbi:hypothetical protein [Vreelandella profundi]|uniref:hypothetical protein n=1 Tax=Vreelandella profundi TaxID=2852117 RepID=UPI001F487626|nr:hypothetical protein [Halomonas profundi]